MTVDPARRIGGQMRSGAPDGAAAWRRSVSAPRRESAGDGLLISVSSFAGAGVVHY